MTTQSINSHITIIGGGVAGCCCAIALHNFGVRNLLIIDDGAEVDFKIGESLSPSANTLLKRLGIYNDFLKLGFNQSYGSASCWGSDRVGYNDAIINPSGIGWHLDRMKFERFLEQQTLNREVVWLKPARFKQVSDTESGAVRLEVSTEQGEVENIAELVIDASGRRSVLASQQNASCTVDRPLVCMAALFDDNPMSAGRRLQHMSFIESEEGGWWYTAALPDARRLVAFFTLPELYSELELNDQQSWLKRLHSTSIMAEFSTTLETEDSLCRRFYAASSCHHQLVGKRWLAVGDAASTFDPLTAHGLFKAMEGGLDCASAVVETVQGNAEALYSYETKVLESYRAYRRGRQYFYNLEQRWPNAPFWKAMHTLEI